MFDDQPKKIFKIKLPNSTANEVVEWFEIMESNGLLANSLIELVYEQLKSGKPVESSICSYNSLSFTLELQTNPSVNQDSFFDNLYDLQGSTDAAFKDEKEEKKVKRKMLYV